MRAALACLFLCLTSAGLPQPSALAAEPARRPNILLIVSDDQGWTDLGCIGQKPIKTPHLDRLAAEGVRLTNFYVTWPACTPSRGSILTGRHPLRNGLYDMVRNDLVNYGHRYTPEEYATSPEMTLGLDVREKTLGDVLKAAGYRMGMVGKWDMGQARRFLPLARGFDFFYGHGNNGIDYYTHERYGIHSMFCGNERTKADQGIYATDLFEREAVQFIRSGGGEPWFLYMCFNAPHGASSFGPDADNPRSRAGVQAPEKFLAMYADSSVPEKLRPYYAAVTCMDEAIGRVLKTIRDLGQESSTLVIFHTDNGGSGNGGNAPLAGGKSTLWEGGLRVPCLARWPGQIPAGRVSDEFLTTLELFPTLAAAAGAKPPEGVILDGYDMLRVLQGKAASPRREMFWEFRGQKAARIGSYKWIDSAKAKGLFDLASDPGETHDLTAARPDIAADMQTRWAAWRKEMDAAEPRGPFRDY
ncbi:MAG: sulfatase-like hydrolase/transferase [Planctomycetaceae bacterium]|nr:sulfatase-like hydrolase/transferase [Planctomycetaceae bacterium]